MQKPEPTFPYKAWYLSLAYVPRETEIIRRAGWSNNYLETHDHRWVAHHEVFPHRDAAVRDGLARLEKREAQLKKQQATLEKRRAKLLKEIK